MAAEATAGSPSSTSLRITAARRRKHCLRLIRSSRAMSMRRQFTQVPQEQELAVSLVDALHPSTELFPLGQ